MDKMMVDVQHNDVDDGGGTVEAFDLVCDFEAEVLPLTMPAVLDSNVHHIRPRSANKTVDATISKRRAAWTAVGDAAVSFVSADKRFLRTSSL